METIIIVNWLSNMQDALPLLSKCCTLVCSCGTDDFLITKFCQLIVNLLAKQKVGSFAHE